MNNNRCVSCGEIIPEGRQVCGSCERETKWKPKVDCCNHYNKDTFSVGYLANCKTGKASRFKVYICDNCGEAHADYTGIKALLFDLYFKFISKGCILVEEQEQESETR